MSNPLVTVFDVEQHLGRELTDVEETRCALAVDAVFSTLELYLNRKLAPVIIHNERHIIVDEFSRIYPFHGPVTAMSPAYIEFGNYVDVSVGPTYVTPVWETEVYAYGTVVYLTYQAGDLPTASHIPVVKQLILNSVIRSVMQGPQVSYGVISSYSVEGTSITYANTEAPDNIGPIVVGDTRTIDRMRRRVAV